MAAVPRSVQRKKIAATGAPPPNSKRITRGRRQLGSRPTREQRPPACPPTPRTRDYRGKHDNQATGRNPPVTQRARLEEEELPRPRTTRSVQEKDPLGAGASRVGSPQTKAGAALSHNPMRPGRSPWPPSALATPRAQGARPVASGRSPRGQARAQPNGGSTYSDPLMYPIQNSIPKPKPRPGH